MKAMVEVEVDPKIARSMLRIAGYGSEAAEASDREICEMAIKMNDSYGVSTKNITLKEG